MDYDLNKIKTKKIEGINLLKKYFLRYKQKVILTFILIIIFSAGSTFIPKIVEYAINVNIVNSDASGLMRTSFFLVIVAILTSAIIYFSTIVSSRLSQQVLFDLRKDIFEKLQELPLSFYSSNQTGDIIQRMTENVQAINRFFTEGLIRMLNMSSLIIITLIFMAFTNLKLAMISIFAVFSVFAFLIIQGNILQKRLKHALNLESSISSFSQESLNGHKTIVSFNRTNHFYEDFVKNNKNYYDSIKKAYRISSLSDSALSLVNSAATIASLYYSLVLYSRGEIMQGTVILFLSYIVIIFRRMGGISRMWNNFQNGIASAQRISGLLSLKTHIKNSRHPYMPKKETIKGEIEMRNVVFSYGKKTPVLKDINLKIKAGQSVAVVGPTGAGKTTFVNLIARLYEVDKGNILFDNIDIKKWDLEILRNQVGYLIQDTFLFEDTVFNNLRYSNPEITKEDAIKIFKELGALNFIESLPNKLDTMLQSGGINLSSGQRQIIALARVLLRKPKILILDEATSKIDTKSEKMIQKAIERSTKGITSFIIAHRLSTIFKADLIVLIQDNIILEKGSHEELIELKGKYYEMYSKFIGK
jgi:ATP-binding cassette, subfamily B, multidrug efflux pump